MFCVSHTASPHSRSFAGHSFHSSRWDYAYTGGDATGALASKTISLDAHAIIVLFLADLLPD